MKCFLKRKKKGEYGNPYEEDQHYLNVNGVAVRLKEGEPTEQQFIQLKELMEERLGIAVTKTAVVKHAIALAYQYYSNKVGVGGF